jgi:hypothetical protein
MDYAWPGQRARARERHRARRRPVAQRRRSARDLPDASPRRPEHPTQLTFEIGTPLDEIELRVIRETLASHQGGQVGRRAAPRHLDAHHLPQARRRARVTLVRRVDTLSLRRAPPCRTSRQAVQSASCRPGGKHPVIRRVSDVARDSHTSPRGTLPRPRISPWPSTSCSSATSGR